MRGICVNVIPCEKSLVIAALESGIEAVVLPDGDSNKVRQFGTIKPVNNSDQPDSRRTQECPECSAEPG